MKSVILKGRSQHGKNRVREQGEVWIVKDQRNSINTPKHVGCQGPFWLLLGLNDDLRWVSTTDDPDFEIVTVRETTYGSPR